MSFEDLGATGAKRQSFYSGPRKALREILTENPNLDEAGALASFTDKMVPYGWDISIEHRELLEAIIVYWFTRNYKALVDRTKRTKTKVKKNVDAVVEVTRRIRDRILSEAKIMFLSWVLPNGKTVAESTGAECQTFAKRIGPWLGKVASAVEPEQVVGEVLSEEQIKEMWVETCMKVPE